MALLDDLIIGLDEAIRTLSGEHTAQRKYPAEDIVEATLSKDESQHAAGLMRVNHTGEICAQALYEGQALSAREDEVRASLKRAADEESDHLAWCAQRLDELGSKPSVLNPLFYAASYAMGAVTGLLWTAVLPAGACKTRAGRPARPPGTSATGWWRGWGRPGRGGAWPSPGRGRIRGTRATAGTEGTSPTPSDSRSRSWRHLLVAAGPRPAPIRRGLRRNKRP